MNEQYSTSDFVERTDMDTTRPEVNLDPLADKVAVGAALIPETPVNWNDDSAIGSMNGPLAGEIPVHEAPVEEVPMDVMIVDHETSTGETITHEEPIDTNAGSSAALLKREQSEHFRTRWNEIQGMFVDEPRSAVQQADGLVSEVVEQITQMFASEHSSLEDQWKQGNDVSTEDLRKALQRYRAFFNRLVV